MPDAQPEDEALTFVRKKSIPGRGRGLVAAGKGFDRPRETIVCIRTPLLLTLDSANLQERCYQCFRQDKPSSLLGKPVGSLDDDGGDDGDDSVALKSCLGCHTVKYCSKTCQSRSWREGHKLECKIFGSLHPRVLPSMVRGVIRLLNKLQLKPKPQPKGDQMDEKQQQQWWQDFLTLESHEQELLSAGCERAQDLYLMAKAAQKYSGTKEPLALVLRICCILTVNCLTLTDAVLEPVGIALDPLAALLNHSCEPNCVIRFDGGGSSAAFESKSSPILGGSSSSISVDVLRPISPGEELTISYIDNTQPLDHRQADLRSRYFFKCTCARCSRGTNTPFERLLTQVESAEAREAKAYATDVLAACLSSPQTQRPLSSRISTISQALARLARSRTFPIHRHPGAQLRVQLVLALIEAGQWREATLQSGLLVYRIDPILYPEPHHPLRIVSKWRLYRLAQHLLLLHPSSSSTSTTSSSTILGKAEDEATLLQTTLVVTISSLQLTPPPPLRPRSLQHDDDHGDDIPPPSSSLDSLLAQALADLRQQQQFINPALLTAYDRDSTRMQDQLARHWNKLIDRALEAELS